MHFLMFSYPQNEPDTIQVFAALVHKHNKVSHGQLAFDVQQEASTVSTARIVGNKNTIQAFLANTATTDILWTMVEMGECRF